MTKRFSISIGAIVTLSAAVTGTAYADSDNRLDGLNKAIENVTATLGSAPAVLNGLTTQTPGPGFGAAIKLLANSKAAAVALVIGGGTPGPGFGASVSGAANTTGVAASVGAAGAGINGGGGLGGGGQGITASGGIGGPAGSHGH